MKRVFKMISIILSTPFITFTYILNSLQLCKLVTYIYKAKHCQWNVCSNAFNYLVLNAHNLYIDSETCWQLQLLYKLVTCIYKIKYCEWNGCSKCFQFFVYNIHNVYIYSGTCLPLYKLVTSIYKVKHYEWNHCELYKCSNCFQLFLLQYS